jgi:hypothetical protein
MSLNGSPKYNRKATEKFVKNYKEIWNKEKGLNEFHLNEDPDTYKEEKKRIQRELDEKYLVKNIGASSDIKTGAISKRNEKGNSIKLSEVLRKKSLDQMIFKSTQNKIERARKFSEGDPKSDFSVSEMNELAKEVYTIKDQDVRNKFAEELINIQTKINTQNKFNDYVGTSSNIKTGIISKRDGKGNFVKMSDRLKQESKDQRDLLNFSKDNIELNKLDPNLINPLEKFKINKKEKEVPTLGNNKEDKNKIEKLSKKGVGMTWPTPNKKVASYIERLFTANLDKGEHWKLVGEFSKDLAKKGSEYLITTPLGIEKNRKKIKDEIEKVMDYPGFEELIKNDKFMKKNKIKKPYQLSSLLEKLQEPGFDLFKEEQDKLKNNEKKIIKKAIDIFNYYKTTPEYLDDKNEDDEEKADAETSKKNKKLSKRLNRLASNIDQEDLKKKKRDIQGIREKADFRNFIETLENSSGLTVTNEEEYKNFIERALIKIREDNLMSRGQVRDIEDYISKSEAKAA